jgi:hypothetical protein
LKDAETVQEEIGEERREKQIGEKEAGGHWPH